MITAFLLKYSICFGIYVCLLVLQVTFAFTVLQGLSIITFLSVCLHLLVSFHEQAVPQDMHQFWFEFLILFSLALGLMFLVSASVFNDISLLKGHIQRLDGHYVCSCGFQRGIYICCFLTKYFHTNCI